MQFLLTLLRQSQVLLIPADDYKKEEGVDFLSPLVAKTKP